MRPTRQLWAVGLLAGLLAVFAVVLARPLALLGPVFLGSWILIRQYQFLQALSATVESLTVSQSLELPVAQTGETVPVTLAARADTPVSIAVAIEAGLPHAGRLDDTGEPLSVGLAPGETRAAETAPVTWPVAGDYQFSQAAVTVTDGLFRQTLQLGEAPTMRVEPRGPTNLHIGTGGEQVTTLGNHRGGLLEAGLEPAEIREYLPGDEAKQIDWKATARLATPYVREYEGETDHPLLLVLDERQPLWTGPPAETKLDYLREAALELTASARRFTDPIGLLTLTENGVTTRIDPSTASTTYTRVRRELFERDSTARTPQSSPGSYRAGSGRTPPAHHSRSGHRPPQRPARARALLEPEGAASDQETAFVESLRPFFETPAPDRHADADSFLGGLRSALRRQDRRLQLVLCTDDSAPHLLWDAVKAIRERGHTVLVLVTPSVLFEPGELADLDAAYDRYVRCEQLRRDLDQLDGVRALEVAPGDRVATVLQAGRDRRRGETRE